MSGKGRKHKRGERGSVEEEINVAKKQNMEAASKDPEIHDSRAHGEEGDQSSKETEISLKEVVQLLQKVQQTLQEMRAENRNVANELRELKASFNKQSSEVNTLKQALKGAEKVTDQLTKSVEFLKKKIEKQLNEINELYGQQDNLEQYTRKNSLEIHGIPEEIYTSTEDVIIKLGEQLQVPISPEDMDISHKLYSGKNNPKSIIMKFVSHKKKSQLYKKRTELKEISLADIFPGFSMAVIAKSRGIFINENLTPYRKYIMKKANELKKDRMIQSVWTLDSKIFVKTSPEGSPIRIYCEDDLDNL